ncbi:YeeE/YedE family protein [Methylobacter sp.]|uniref:YeeE/YedE family protein n=1 Tax=Methylobacter sp. TaxID=2051955 RepID=UPI00248846B2|nr:YeeE/YedE family protein [Methylobacter sp.]MDI1278275.1 YeeE/YedE family protein [Methylobacter sp.]MDI1359033.1 YeeE/YedE family protein [Methylobacter sp.]
MNPSDFTHSAYIAGLSGGLLIGIAAALFVLLNGRIAGISGILAGLFQADKGDKTWRVLFLLGMTVAPFVYQIASDLPSVTIEAGTGQLIIAGLLVGLGTSYASGCTSGHGVCGISRGSIRSIAATLTFMMAGIITVYLTRHLIGL